MATQIVSSHGTDAIVSRLVDVAAGGAGGPRECRAVCTARISPGDKGLGRRLDSDIWQGPAGHDNWTDETGAINVPWADGGIAVFSGSGTRFFFGDVFVDTSLGAVRASGIEVTNGGYSIYGEWDPITGKFGPIEFVGAPTSTIRVDDNAGALISLDLTGNTRLRKTGPGGLYLYGLNSYTGGTDIDGGTLAV